MAATDQQGENETQSRSSSARPQTPPAKNHEPTQFVFQKYTSPRAEKTDDEVTMVDKEVRFQLTKVNIKVDKKVSHLYVFSSPEAKGLYKVGSAQHPSRPTTQQEECYPEHQLICFIECPNAGLFEKVVHAEFLLSRHMHDCGRCKKSGEKRRHREWIKAPLQDIIQSVSAWSLYARWFHRCGIDIDKQQQRILLCKSSERADRWRNWALQEAARWMKGARHGMPPISRECVQEQNRETRTADEYSSDSAPELSNSPGSTPGSEGICDPPMPLTPTPVSQGLVMNMHAQKQTNALWTPEETASWEDATTKPIARALFSNRVQRPSDKGRTLLGAEDATSHVSLTEGCSKKNENRHAESSLEEKDVIQGILNAEIDQNVREVLARVVTEVQVTNAGPVKASGIIYFLSHESAKGIYRICCRSGKGLSPGKECCDNTTAFRDIPNYMAVKKMLLRKFGVPPPGRKCERCGKTHRDWIKVSEEDIKTSIGTQKEFVNVGCLNVHDQDCERSKEPDSLTGGGDEVAQMQKDKTAVEDVSISIPPSKSPVIVDVESCTAPEGKTNGGLGEMVGKSTVSKEQQAPGLVDVCKAGLRNILEGLL